MSSIELDDMSQPKPPVEPTEATYNALDENRDNTIALWTWATATLLFLFSTCLILFPRLLLFFAETGVVVERRAAMTPLETFLAQHFGLMLLAVNLTLVLNVPSAKEPIVPRNWEKAPLPHHPLLGPLTGVCALSAFMSWNTKDVGSLATIVCVGTSVISLWGLWATVFAGSSVISHKTGADKHTSSFLFGNKSAASKQKAEWKKAQKGR